MELINVFYESNVVSEGYKNNHRKMTLHNPFFLTTKWIKRYTYDFRPPTRSRWELCSSGLLRSDQW